MLATRMPYHIFIFSGNIIAIVQCQCFQLGHQVRVNHLYQALDCLPPKRVAAQIKIFDISSRIAAIFLDIEMVKYANYSFIVKVVVTEVDYLPEEHLIGAQVLLCFENIAQLVEIDGAMGIV